MITVAVYTKEEPEADRRYRVLVLLNRTDRPSYTKFQCYRCGYPVAELVNSEVHAMTDTMDMDNSDARAIGTRCDGRYQGGYCRIWYYFSLGEPKNDTNV